MAQHFLLSAAARSLSAAKIMRMSARCVENVFARILRNQRTEAKIGCNALNRMTEAACRASVRAP